MISAIWCCCPRLFYYGPWWQRCGHARVSLRTSRTNSVGPKSVSTVFRDSGLANLLLQYFPPKHFHPHVNFDENWLSPYDYYINLLIHNVNIIQFCFDGWMNISIHCITGLYGIARPPGQCVRIIIVSFIYILNFCSRPISLKRNSWYCISFVCVTIVALLLK